MKPTEHEFGHMNGGHDNLEVWTGSNCEVSKQ